MGPKSPGLKSLRLAVAAAAAMALVAWSAAAGAADTTLLIQVDASGKFKVWHAEGRTNLSENEALAIEASATPEGGDEVPTTFGPARGFKTPQGVVISVPGALFDRTLLLGHDACAAPKIWHSEGTTRLSDDQLADIVFSATPDGGKSIQLGNQVVKGYTTEYGVMAVIFAAPAAKKR